MINRRLFQYRLIWQREGDRYDRRRVFNNARGCYLFVLRMCDKEPWKGTGRVTLRRSWALLAHQMNVPVADVMKYTAREACAALQAGNRPVAWLRIETRQVGAWHEMVEPMETLAPKKFAQSVVVAAAYCDELDQHPERRWQPEMYDEKSARAVGGLKDRKQRTTSGTTQGRH